MVTPVHFLYSIYVGAIPVQFLYSIYVGACIVIRCSLTYEIFCLFQFRLVVKTALKLLLVFIEYTESNTQHLIKAVNTVDKKRSKYLYNRDY